MNVFLAVAVACKPVLCVEVEPGILDWFTAVASALAGLGATAAVIVAVAALRSARTTVAFDHALGSLAALLASIKAMSRVSYGRFGQVDEDLLTRESQVRYAGPFFALTSDIQRVRLVLPALTQKPDEFDWMLDAVNNLGSNLLQAAEFSLFDMAPEDGEKRVWADKADWAYLKESALYGLAFALTKDLEFAPGFTDEDADRMLRGWGQDILRARAEGFSRNVYTNDASYITQATRLLEDFTNQYLDPALRRLLAGR